MSDADATQLLRRAIIGRYGTPERRQLEQIVFPTAGGSAAPRLARLDNEFSFEALAKERGMSEKDLDLGLVTKSRHRRSARSPMRRSP